MDIKNLLFKYVDKVVFVILALYLAYVVIYSPIFGTSLRPVQVLPFSTQIFDRGEKEKEVKSQTATIQQKLRESRPAPFEDLKQASQLRAAPPEAPELRLGEWGAPTDIFEAPIKLVAGILQVIRLPVKPSGLKKTKGEDSIEVKEVPGSGGLELRLKGIRGETKAEFEWRDPNNIRHVQSIEILKAPETYVALPPTDPKAAMDKVAVHLTWKGPANQDLQHAPITKYKVFRRKAEESQPQEIATVPVSAGKAAREGETAPAVPKGGGEYSDKAIEFNTKYVYTVRSIAPNAQPQDSEASAAAEVEDPSDIEFFVKGVIEREGVKNATVKVWKLASEKWEYRSFNALVPGEAIGALIPARGDRPALDFRTGATLVDADAGASLPVISIFSRPAGMEGGQVKMVDEVTLRPGTYKGKIVYLDRRGELKEKWMTRELYEEMDNRFKGIPVQGPEAPKTPPGPAAPPAPGGEKKPEELKPVN